MDNLDYKTLNHITINIVCSRVRNYHRVSDVVQHTVDALGTVAMSDEAYIMRNRDLTFCHVTETALHEAGRASWKGGVARLGQVKPWLDREVAVVELGSGLREQLAVESCVVRLERERANHKVRRAQ